MNFLINNITYLDYAIRWQIGFQDSATSIMQGIINLHHHIFFFILIVITFVFFIFYRTYDFSVWNFRAWNSDIFKDNNYSEKRQFLKKLNLCFNLNVNHGTILEIIWTIIPSLILLMIVGPSFTLLYAMDAASDPDYSIKVIGHQWYWTYEYSDHYFIRQSSDESKLAEYVNDKLGVFTGQFNATKVMPEYIFDSYMKATTDLLPGELRLLEVDNPLFLPVYSKIRLDITSDDVLHAFAVPSLGVKVDAVPGRLNVAYLDIIREGIYFGQCSELCGVNHGYMPIKVIVVDVKFFVENQFLFCREDLNVFFSTLNFNDTFNFIKTSTNFEKEFKNILVSYNVPVYKELLKNIR
jgi:cytochrome c oxidase subunit 2